MAQLGERVPAPVWLGLLFAGMTAVMVGYFAVWLPGPAAGLRLIGLELGEWIKFLGVGASRNYFYMPPIVLGLIMVLVTAGWRNNTWATWLFRGLAVMVSMLAFPAVAAITMEAQSEWLARLVGIVLVLIGAFAIALVPQSDRPVRRAWWGVFVLSLLGFVVPLWQYASVQPIVSEILRQPIGMGLGVLLNSLGFSFILIVAIRVLLAHPQSKPTLHTHG